MFPHLGPAAQEVAKIEVDLIIQVGAPICLAQGLGGDKKIIALIEQATGVPATPCVTSMVQGLQRMDVHKVVVVCPLLCRSLGEHAAHGTGTCRIGDCVPGAGRCCLE